LKIFFSCIIKLYLKLLKSIQELKELRQDFCDKKNEEVEELKKHIASLENQIFQAKRDFEVEIESNKEKVIV
jgi:hypothetical protein